MSLYHSENGARTVLLPHQAKLVETFFDPAAKREILLRSDVGLGKTVAIAAIVRRVREEDPRSRVLYLGPRALGAQIVEVLAAANVNGTIVDRYRYRELVGNAIGDDLWPSGIVAVLSLDFAKQSDIRESLVKARWKLVIGEEGQWINGARLEAFREITKSADRVILTIMTGLEPAGSFAFESATVVEWRREWIVDSAGKPLDKGSRPRLHESSFAQNQAEIAFGSSVRDLCNSLRENMPTGVFVAASILRCLESSPAAVEASLRRLSFTMSVDSEVDRSAEVLDADASDEFGTGGIVYSISNSAGLLARRALDAMLEVGFDSKLGAFEQLIDSVLALGSMRKRVCVLTDFRATLYYLDASLKSDREIECQLVHGEMANELRSAMLSEFNSKSGILLGTSATILASPPPSDVTDLIFYDLPGSIPLLRQMLGRFDRIGRVTQLQVYVLADSGLLSEIGVARLEGIRALLEDSATR